MLTRRIKFGGHSFPKSHAAAFAVLVYQSAWLKCYYPAAFACALLNHQPMGFWPPAIIVSDVKRHGVDVLPVDVERSMERCTLDGADIRLGLTYVGGLGEAAAQRIVARQTKPFVDLADFCRRAQLPRASVERLIQAGACDGWQRARRDLRWELGTLRYTVRELDLPIPSSAVQLPALTPAEARADEIAILVLQLYLFGN